MQIRAPAGWIFIKQPSSNSLPRLTLIRLKERSRTTGNEVGGPGSLASRRSDCCSMSLKQFSASVWFSKKKKSPVRKSSDCAGCSKAQTRGPLSSANSGISVRPAASTNVRTTRLTFPTPPPLSWRSNLISAEVKLTLRYSNCKLQCGQEAEIFFSFSMTGNLAHSRMRPGRCLTSSWLRARKQFLSETRPADLCNTHGEARDTLLPQPLREKEKWRKALIPRPLAFAKSASASAC